MKLEINLDDRAEIEAAVPLLQLILDGTMKRTGGAVAPAPLHPIAAPSSAAVAPPPTAPAASPVIPPPPVIVPAPPAPVAPTASAPPAPAAPSTPAPVVDVDSTGLPWDERIHAGTKAKVQNGTLWKLKRGVDETLVAQVQAELRATMAARVPGVTAQEVASIAPALAAAFAVPPGMDAAAAAAFGGAAAPAPLPPSAIVPPAAPSVPAPPAASLVGADPTTFETLMPRVSAAAVAGTLPPSALQAACAAQGLASVVALQTSPAFVPLVWAALKQQYPGL